MLSSAWGATLRYIRGNSGTVPVQAFWGGVVKIKGGVWLPLVNLHSAVRACIPLG